MKTVVNFLLLLCLVANSLCDNENPASPSGIIVNCEIVPEEISYNFLKTKTQDMRGGRVVLGNYASTNQFPYYGYTVLYRSTTAILCGSSLISSTWAVTAAHCMRDVTSGQVYLGSNDSQLKKVSQAISKYIRHPSYSPSNLSNDIAVIQLYAAVPFSSSVQAIKLPTRSQVGRIFSGVNLLAAGFGRTSTEYYPRYLQYTTLTGLAYDQCIAAHWVYNELMICGKSAFNTGSSVCSGDSGGPLAEQGASVSVLVGVSSYVQSESCINDIQGFTRVDKYLDWISGHTGIFINW